MAGRLRGRVARAPEVTVVTVGDAAVGKTALIQRFCNDTFPQVTLRIKSQIFNTLCIHLPLVPGQKCTCNYNLTETSIFFWEMQFSFSYSVDSFA